MLMKWLTKLGLAAPVLALVLGAAPAPAATFTLSPAPYVEGGSVTFSFDQPSHVKPNYEMTLAIWCTEPDGAQIPWGNLLNPYVYEFNSFGRQGLGNSVTMALPVEGTGYFCEALYLAVDWSKGSAQQSWALDFQTFQVGT
jgi:hypothetical protein